MRNYSASGWIVAAAVAAALCLPAAAQSADQSTANPTSSATATAPATAKPPLKPNLHQGFWGRLNPFARKKYVQNQLSPIRGRVNELDGLTTDNANAVAKLDARNRAALAAASDRARNANDTADAAQQQVQQDAQQADQLNTRVAKANTKLEGVDQYQVAQQAELHFRPGPVRLNADTQQRLDSFFSGLASQKGYVVEVTAYSSRKGVAGVDQSQQLANAVVRHLVLENNIPLYRIYTMGMGDAQPASMQTAAGAARSTAGGTVDIKILRNSLSQ
jgi:outer membrane protein OmpA-like peptidoglycan-associated protein